MKQIFLLLVSVLFVTGSSVLAQDQDRTKKQDRIHQEDHLRLKDGSCLLIKQGIETKLETPFTLKNGVIVNPDGSYQLQNQQRYQMRDGECMDMSGNRYLNQNRFNKQKMMTNKQVERVRTKVMNKNRAGNQDGARRGNNN